MNLKDFCKELETIIQGAYENGVTMEEAERLAARFLFAQIKLSEALKERDLSSRMRKSGVKAVRAALYTDIKSKADKITEAAITALLDSNELVSGEQTAFDEAEVERDELERMFDICSQGHVYFRQVSKPAFGG